MYIPDTLHALSGFIPWMTVEIYITNSFKSIQLLSRYTSQAHFSSQLLNIQHLYICMQKFGMLEILKCSKVIHYNMMWNSTRKTLKKIIRWMNCSWINCKKAYLNFQGKYTFYICLKFLSKLLKIIIQKISIRMIGR